jgi:hypothetical protein
MRSYLLAILMLLALPVRAQEPLPAAHRRPLGAFVHEAKRHLKQSFTDMRRDPLWGLVVVGNIGLNFADTGTTCKFRSLGVPEANPLLPKRQGCAFYVGTTVAVTTAQIGLEHYLRERATNWCRKDAADPNSMYTHIAQSRGVNPSPTGCTYGMDAIFMTTYPLHYMVIRNNIWDIEHYKLFQ